MSRVAAVVGIDAAWTDHHPSAVAKLVRRRAGWTLERLGRSYAEWNAVGQVDDWWSAPSHGSGRSDLADAVPTLRGLHAVAVDMPLAATPIVTRRASDQALSRVYASRGAAVHSPTPERPGPIADAMREALVDAGLRFAPLDDSSPAAGEALRGTFFEVYPHATILELMQLERRLPYKVSRTAKYWPDASPDERRARVAERLDALRAALAERVAGVTDLVPSAVATLASPPPGARPPTLRTLKGLEDALDAVVCAWTAARALEGHATAHGDAHSAIRVALP